jgi:hypothetical protein
MQKILFKWKIIFVEMLPTSNEGWGRVGIAESSAGLLRHS